MPEDRKHVRVYYSIIDDPKFGSVYRSDANLATWLRLLMVADAVWPASAHVPMGTRPAALKALVDAELIDLLPDKRFRIHGLDPERGRRQDAAKNAAAKRWQNEGTADAMQAHSTRIPVSDASKAEQSIEEQSKAEQDARAEPYDPWEAPEQEALVWLSKHGCDVRPGNGYHRKLIAAVEVHGVNAIVGMLDRLASAGTKHGDTKGFLFGAIDALDARGRPKLSELEAEDRAEERDEAFVRRVARTRERNAPIRALIETSDANRESA